MPSKDAIRETTELLKALKSGEAKGVAFVVLKEGTGNYYASARGGPEAAKRVLNMLQELHSAYSTEVFGANEATAEQKEAMREKVGKTLQ
jgi:hypothetical protein